MTLTRFAGGAMAIVGFIVTFVIDIYSIIWIANNHGVGWAGLTLFIPPAWALAPFLAGMAIPFIIGVGLLIVGGLITEGGTA